LRSGACLRFEEKKDEEESLKFLLFLVLIALLMVVRTVKSALSGMTGLPVVLGHSLAKEEGGWKLIIVDGHGN
jgi:hypothetical protein